MGHIELAAPVAHVWYTRRVPSYLGLLLDVSRRNLDRVLYFAQYVITSVDEDARSKAVKRIEDELDRMENSSGSDLDTQIEAIKQMRDTDLGELQTQIDDIHSRYNEERDRLSEEIMKEAQSLQRRIESMKGQTLSNPLVFESAGEMIADVGEF